MERLDEVLKPKLESKKVILLFNKANLLTEGGDTFDVKKILPQLKCVRLPISAKTGYKIETLLKLLVEAAAIPEIGEGDVIVTNMRHYEALSKALSAIRRVQQGLNSGVTHDLLTQDMRETMFYIGEITGQITTDEILGNIFRNFCIGK